MFFLVLQWFYNVFCKTSAKLMNTLVVFVFGWFYSGFIMLFAKRLAKLMNTLVFGVFVGFSNGLTMFLVKGLRNQ